MLDNCASSGMIYFIKPYRAGLSSSPITLIGRLHLKIANCKTDNFLIILIKHYLIIN